MYVIEKTGEALYYIPLKNIQIKLNINKIIENNSEHGS